LEILTLAIRPTLRPTFEEEGQGQGQLYRLAEQDVAYDVYHLKEEVD
jgi:hypothetical protein